MWKWERPRSPARPLVAITAVVAVVAALTIGGGGPVRAASDPTVGTAEPRRNGFTSAPRMEKRSAEEIRAMAADGGGSLLTIRRPAETRADARSADAAGPWWPDIICILDVNDPHGGGHPNRDIFVDAWILCSDFVDFINIRVQLFRDNVEVLDEEITFALVPGLVVTAHVPCAAGRYFAIAEGTVAAFDHNPPIVGGVVDTRTVDVSCGFAIPPPPTRPA